ncbi:MAG TPA: ComEC/Rec2 family competence protein [Mycobacteriales bacterium]|nr:ComEC/Rec2 family competence protein [Mycobacteriales bacterium]
MSSPVVEAERGDLRLVPAGAVIWAVTVIGLHLPPAGSFLLAGLGAGVAVVARVRGGRAAAAVLLAAGCGAAAAAAIGVRMLGHDASPLVGMAQRHESATVRVVLRSDPRPLGAGFGGVPRYVVDVSARTVLVNGRSWRGGGSLVLLASGAEWGQLLPSQSVLVSGRLQPPDRADLTVAVITARGPPRDVGEPSWVQSRAGRLRAALRSACAGLPEGARQLLPGLVTGDVSTMSPLLLDEFKTAGLTHLVAVSGTNVTIICGAVLLLARWCRLGPRSSAVCAGLALVGFVVLARPSPSVLRAAVMGALVLVALVIGRSRSVIPALAAAVGALVFVSPALAVSAGFAMSVAATAALILVAPRWAQALRSRRVPRGLAEGLAVAAAANLVTAPLVVAIGGNLSCVSIPANLLAAPAVAPATVLGVAVVPATLLPGPLAPALAWLASWPARWIVGVARRAAAVPDTIVRWPGGTSGALLLVLALIAGAIALRRPVIRRTAAAAALGVGCVMLPTRLISPGWPPPQWFFAACDVGQGDGLVLNAGGGRAVVIDTGPEPQPIDRCLRRLRVRRVSLLIATHMDADHVAGVAGVYDHRPVDAVIAGPLHMPLFGWSTFNGAAVAHHLRVGSPSAGTQLQIGAVSLQVLGPLNHHPDRDSVSNDSCLVIRATVQHHTVLLTGDAGPDEQAALVAAGVDLRAEVLKVPHHGSRFFDPEFIDAVHARLGVISVGADNEYGHPTPTLLAALARDQMTVARTDLRGTVAVCDVHGQLATVSP